MSDRSTAMRWARWFAVVVIVTIGSAAFALSFAALKELAVMARTPEGLAWLWPVIVDGTIIQATVSVLVLANSPERRWFLWVLAAGALVSITGNSVHAALADGGELPWWAAALVAAVAPISLLVDTHGLSLLFQASQRSTEPVTTPAPAPTSAAEPAIESAVDEPVAEPVTPKPKPLRRRPAKSRRDPVQVARAVAMRAEGKSYTEIGKALGVSATTAANYAPKTSQPAAVSTPEPVAVAAAPVASAAVPVAAQPAPVVRPAPRLLPVSPMRSAQQVLPIAIPARGV